MDANLGKLEEVEAWLVKSHSCVLSMEVGYAREEIVRLRASQFKWVSVDERCPKGADWVLAVLFGSPHVHMVKSEHLDRVNYTHWAPIPPLPEKSQADRDDEMLRAWIKSLGAEHTDRENSLRIGYLEGLKAAREQKA